MAKRRKWWIIGSLLLVLAAGGIYLHQAPKVYKTSTLILVEAQRVPNNFVPSTVSEELQSRLQTIYQQVHSRTNLEKIVQRFELLSPGDRQGTGLAGMIRTRVLSLVGLVQASDKEQQAQEPSTQEVVQLVRSKLDVSLRAKNQAFEISFEWDDPVLAAQVTNAIATQFINQNLKVREEMAMGTTLFLNAEVTRLRQELQQREKALEDFNRRHMGRLPSQLESNLNILSQLKEELGQFEDREEQLRQQLALVRQQIQTQDQEVLLDTPEGAQARELQALQQRLQELRIRYKKQHPDVQALLHRITQLQLLQAQQVEQASVQALPEGSADPGQENALLLQQEQLQMRLANFNRKQQELRDQIKVYEQRVEQTSEVELELKNLERDYAAVNDRFQNVLRRKLDAEMAEQMERRQQGEQFKVVDPAIPPNSPFKPDRNRVLFLSLALGLGLGGGLGYLREGLDPAYYTPKELEQDLGAKVVVCLPYVQS